MAAAAVGFGLALRHEVHLAGPLLFQSLLGFGDSALAPAITGFLGSCRPDQAGAAGSVLLFLSFASCSVVVSVAVIISDALGVDVFFAIIAAIVAAAALWATVCNFARIRRRPGQQPAPGPTALGAQVDPAEGGAPTDDGSSSAAAAAVAAAATCCGDGQRREEEEESPGRLSIVLEA